MKLKITGLLALASAVLIVSGCGLQPVQEFTPTPTPAPTQAPTTETAPAINKKEQNKAEENKDTTKEEKKEETAAATPTSAPTPTPAATPTPTPEPTPALKQIGTKTEESVTVPFENATEKDFAELYITWEGADSWGENVLAGENFAAGEKAELSFTPTMEEGSYYNIQIVCADQSLYYVTRIPFDDISDLQIFMQDEDTWARYTTISDKQEVNTYEVHHANAGETAAETAPAETAAAADTTYYDPNAGANTYVNPYTAYDPNTGLYYDPYTGNFSDANYGNFYYYYGYVGGTGTVVDGGTGTGDLINGGNGTVVDGGTGAGDLINGDNGTVVGGDTGHGDLINGENGTLDYSGITDLY